MDSDAVFPKIGDTAFPHAEERRTAPAASGTSLTGSSFPRPAFSPSSPMGAADKPHHHERLTLLDRLMRWIDIATIGAASMFVSWLGSHIFLHTQVGTKNLANLVAILVYFLVVRPTALPPLPALGLREILATQIRSIAPAVCMAALVRAGTVFWLGWPLLVSVRTTCTWFLFAAAALIIARVISVYALYHPKIERKLTQNFAIIGYDAYAIRVAERFRTAPRYRIRIVGVFDPREKFEPKGLNGSIKDLIGLSSTETKLDGIIIALPPGSRCDKEIAELAWSLRNLAADVFIMPYLIHGPDLLLPLQTVGQMPLMVLQRRPLDSWQAICKRVFDLSIALIVLPFFLPILAVVAIAIKFDSPGPILFRQPRRGLNNEMFSVFKFRTMYASATDTLAVRQTSRGDPRVTRIGGWLRRLSIDELPQLLNVLRGEMSLVGPRPHAPQTRIEGELLEAVVADYVIRYKIKPGITGWAQVNGARGELVKRDDLHKRVTFDLEYMQCWSIGFDLKILLLTAAREIISKHAY